MLFRLGIAAAGLATACASAQESPLDLFEKNNLVRQVERIRELGLKPAKPLPAALTELAFEADARIDAGERQSLRRDGSFGDPA